MVMLCRPTPEAGPPTGTTGRHPLPNSSNRQELLNRLGSILDAPLPACLQLAVPPLKPCSTLYLGDLLHPLGTRSRTTATAGTVKGVDRPIHEVLLEKGRLAQERHERRVECAIAEEVSHLRPAPTITQVRTSRPPSGQRIEDKLLRRARERQEELERRQELRIAETSRLLAATAPFHPHISQKGQQATSRFRETLVNKEAWLKQRRSEIALAKEEAERQEARGTPLINPRSVTLAAMLRQRDGVESLPTGEALLQREEMLKAKRAAARAASADGSRQGRPTLSTMAQRLERRGSTCQRLYRDNFRLTSRRIEREAQMDAEHVPFHPKITSRAASTSPRYRRPTPVQESGRMPEANCNTFRPTIDPVSAAIARQLPESSADRLYCGSSRCRSLSHKSSELDESPATTRCRTTAIPEALAEAFYAYEEQRQRRLKELRDEETARVVRHCTFAPRVNHPSAVQADPQSFALRTRQWLQRREEKLQAQRAESATAATNVGKRFGRLSTVLTRESERSIFSRGPGETPFGTDAFVARLTAARCGREARLRHEALGVPNSDAATRRERIMQREERFCDVCGSHDRPNLEVVHERVYRRPVLEHSATSFPLRYITLDYDGRDHC